MQALVYRFAPVRWLAARAVSHSKRFLALRAGPLTGLRLQDVQLPAPPSPEWVPVRVHRAGICGTDLATLSGRAGPQLSPFVSFPAVLGHEIVGTAEAGPLQGRRVVLDPFLGCRPRGLSPLCPACSRGQAALCERFAEGPLAPGMLLGYCRSLPGGWAERLWAHPSQLHPVPDGLEDEVAVLAEPLAVGLHAVLAAPPSPGERVLVLGAGTIGLCVLFALRAVAPDVAVAVVARHPVQQALARRLGAVHVAPSVRQVARWASDQLWLRTYAGLLGARGPAGGFDQVYDAVGSATTLGAALHLARAGGRVALVGSSGLLSLDLTFLWAHEVSLQGYCGYGEESRLPATLAAAGQGAATGSPLPGGPHTIALALQLLAQRPDLPLAQAVTHRFPLSQHRRALAACFDHRRSGAIKVLLVPPEAP